MGADISDDRNEMAQTDEGSATWARLRTVLEDALGLPAEARLAFVHQKIEHAALRLEAEQLLALDQDASKLFAMGGWHGRAATLFDTESDRPGSGSDS
jgi:hypothetical protein